MIKCLSLLVLLPLAVVAEPSSHWAFQAVKEPAVPQTKDTKWARDPIDQFVLARLEQAGLVPNPDADRALLLRRVTFDLTGLPPTVEEVSKFQADKDSTDVALARVVKRLLESPRYGEHWGRHWLDVVRYADTSGGERPRALPLAWRYRDWVVDALNADKPYPRFVAEQIAGDLAPNASQDMTAATAFLVLGAYDLSMIGKPVFVMDRVHEQIDTTTRAFLGLSVGCARCHDHKYDPVKQTDYYGLAGVFLSSRSWFGTGMETGMSLKELKKKNTVKRPNAAEDLDSTESRSLGPRPWVLPTSGGHQVILRNRSEKVGIIEGNGDDVMTKEQRTEARVFVDAREAMGVSDGAPANCALRVRGEVDQIGPMVPRGGVAIPGLPSISPITDKESGRMQLAAWIISPANPLTNRVIANRVWMHLFGRGLVTTPNDFGVLGNPPTHPELLDHLALRLARGGGSLKSLIQAIVLSRAYRMDSAGNEAAQKSDPDNKLLWRMNWKRLSAEELRDAWLQIAGELTDDRPSGAQIGMLHGEARPMIGVASPFRSLYLPVLRNGRLPEMMEAFDFPDPSLPCAQREATTSSTQALFLLNSQFMQQIAARAGSPVSRVPADRRAEQACMLAFGRHVSPDEVKELGQWLKSSSLEPRAACALLMQTLLSSPEYIYLR